MALLKYFHWFEAPHDKKTINKPALYFLYDITKFFIEYGKKRKRSVIDVINFAVIEEKGQEAKWAKNVRLLIFFFFKFHSYIFFFLRVFCFTKIMVSFFETTLSLSAYVIKMSYQNLVSLDFQFFNLFSRNVSFFFHFW